MKKPIGYISKPEWSPSTYVVFDGDDLSDHIPDEWVYNRQHYYNDNPVGYDEDGNEIFETREFDDVQQEMFDEFKSDLTAISYYKDGYFLDEHGYFYQYQETGEMSSADADEWLWDSDNLEQLCERMNFLSQHESALDVGRVDTSSLPTFGGVDIEYTMGVWSWDADNILVFDNDYKIIPRNNV